MFLKYFSLFHFNYKASNVSLSSSIVHCNPSFFLGDNLQFSSRNLLWIRLQHSRHLCTGKTWNIVHQLMSMKYQISHSTARSSLDSNALDNWCLAEMFKLDGASKTKARSRAGHVFDYCQCVALDLLHVLSEECRHTRWTLYILWRYSLVDSKPLIAAPHNVLSFSCVCLFSWHLEAFLRAWTVRSLT